MRRGQGGSRPLRLLGLTVIAVLLLPRRLLPLTQAFAVGRQILVTGAGGRTGSLVVEKLVASGRYDVRALVRSQQSKAALLRKVPNLPEGSIYVGDIVTGEGLAKAFTGVSAAIVVTSAVPKLKFWSLLPFLLKKLIGQKGKLRFSWKGAKPEQADWEGQKRQFDAAKEAGAKHIVLVGTMTGTQKDSFLNSIGEGDGDNIVMWKRKAEMYLIDLCKSSDIEYTIVHAGGLSDASGGEAPIAVGVDDKLREVKNQRIPRADVAEVCVQSLECKTAKNRSFDVSSIEGRGEALQADGLEKLLETLEGANCDYSINPPP